MIADIALEAIYSHILTDINVVTVVNIGFQDCRFPYEEPVTAKRGNLPIKLDGILPDSIIPKIVRVSVGLPKIERNRVVISDEREVSIQGVISVLVIIK